MEQSSQDLILFSVLCQVYGVTWLLALAVSPI